MDYLETVKRVYRVNKKEISYLRFIFEGYDGIAVIKTIDPQKGIICLYIPPMCTEDVEIILKDLQKEILMENLPAASFSSQDLEL